MTVSVLSEVDVERARHIWDEYQRQHDVSDRIGQAVGVDPVSGAFGSAKGHSISRSKCWLTASSDRFIA